MEPIVSFCRQKNFTSPRIFFKVKKMKCLSNDLKRIADFRSLRPGSHGSRKWFICLPYSSMRLMLLIGNGSYVFPIHLWDSCYWLVKPTTPTWSEINRIKVGPYGTNHIIPTAIFRQNYPLEHIYRLPRPCYFLWPWICYEGYISSDILEHI